MPLALPFTFSPLAQARSAEVNANFQALLAAVNSGVQSIPSDRSILSLQDLLTSHLGYSPDDFGAVGNGVADDSVQVQQAITRSVVTGKRYTPTPGKIYRVTSRLEVNGPLHWLAYKSTLLFDFPVGTSTSNGGLVNVWSSKVRIEGQIFDGTGVVAAIPGVNRYVVRVDPVGATRYSDIELVNCRVANMMASSGALPTTATVHHAFYFRQADRCKVEGCTVENISGSGVFMIDTNGMLVDGNSFAMTGWSHIWPHDGNKNYVITRNRCYGGTAGAPVYWGGAIDDMGQTSDQNLPGTPNENGIIAYNHFIGGVYRYGFVVRLSSSHNILVAGNHFYQCDAENNGALAVVPGTGGAGSHNCCIQVTVRDITLSNGPWKNITILGNKFNPLGAGYQTAILAFSTSGSNTNLLPCEGLLVEDNDFYASAAGETFGAWLYAHGFLQGLQDIVVQGNRGRGYPAGNLNYNPAGLISFTSSDPAAKVRGVQVRDNRFEYWNNGTNQGATNNDTAISVGAYCEAEIEGDTFRNFYRDITVDAAALSVPIHPCRHELSPVVGASAYNLRGNVLTPTIHAAFELALDADEQVTNQTVLQDIPTLQFPIGANEKVMITVELDAGATIATTGAKFAAVGPAGVAVIRTVATLQPNDFTAGNKGMQRSDVSGGSLDFNAAAEVGVTSAIVRMTIYVENGATAGLVKVQYAQQVNSATPLVLRRGSRMKIVRKA